MSSLTRCPQCGTVVPPQAPSCTKCGAARPSKGWDGGGARQFGYPALHFIISVQSAAAWVLGGVIALASLATFPRSPGAGIIGLVLAVVVWAGIMVGAEILQLLMRIEENTRPG